MYAYCNNNPIVACDPRGTSWSDFWENVSGWIDDNIIDPVGQIVVDAIFTVVDAINPNNDINSIQIGKNLTGGLGFYGTLSFGISLTREGEVASYVTLSGGGALGCGWGGNGTITTSDATSIDSLNGHSFSLGGSFSIPVAGPVSLGGGYDYSAFQSYHSNTFSLGVGCGKLPAEFHASWNYTWHFMRNDLYD